MLVCQDNIKKTPSSISISEEHVNLNLINNKGPIVPMLCTRGVSNHIDLIRADRQELRWDLYTSLAIQEIQSNHGIPYHTQLTVPTPRWVFHPIFLPAFHMPCS